MKFKILFLLGVTFCISSVSLAFTVDNTYGGGDISSSYGGYIPGCSDAAELSVLLPAGGPWVVTSVEVTYDFETSAGGYMSEQYSRLYCQNTMLNEIGPDSDYYRGTGTFGTQTYNRSASNIANGLYVGLTNLTFELHAYRTWGDNGLCNTLVNKIKDDSWEVIVTYELAVPMSFVDANTFQASTATVGNCKGSAEILRIEVETSDIMTPLSVTDLSLTTLGTTDLSEIAALNVYYTGTSNTFSNANLFGTAVSPGAVEVVGGVQVLETGINYFWVEYTLITSTTATNTLGGTCTNITVNNFNESNSTPNPGGSRLIVDCIPSPGGVDVEQVWLTSELGVAGASPVTGWTNQGENTSVTTLTGGVGSQLNVNQPNLNFHDGVQNGGGYAGAFKQTFGPKTNLLSNEITMFVVTDGGQDLTLSLHTHSSSTNQYRCFGFRNSNLGSVYSAGGVNNFYNGSATNENMNIYGMRGASNSSGENTSNGFKSTVVNVGAFTTIVNDYEIGVGFWPGYGHTQNTTEAIIWNKKLPAIEFHIVESYLAIKYGVTLGVNGVSMDYNSTSNAVIWNAVTNNGFAWDIAGISRDDNAILDQRKSHSVNGTSTTVFNDIVTVVNGTDFTNPSLMSDKTSFMWGHNNGPTVNTGVIVNYLTDNGETIQTIFQRHWKGQETGIVSDVMLEFDLSLVIGVDAILGNNDLANLRLLVDEDGDFSNGATAYSPISFDNTTNIAYFQTDFTPTDGNNLTQNNGFFFTLGSTNFSTTPLPIQLVSFSGECNKSLTWQTMSETNNDYFTVEKSSDGLNWYQVAKINGNGTTSSIHNYSFKDTEDNNYLTYYRLKQTDFDGITAIVGQTKVECENNKPIIYPNPFNDELFINFKTEGKYLVSVRDVLGRIIYSEEFIETNSSVHYLDLSHVLSKGLYYVSILQNEKTILLNEKIVKN